MCTFILVSNASQEINVRATRCLPKYEIWGDAILVDVETVYDKDNKVQVKYQDITIEMVEKLINASSGAYLPHPRVSASGMPTPETRGLTSLRLRPLRCFPTAMSWSLPKLARQIHRGQNGRMERHSFSQGYHQRSSPETEEQVRGNYSVG